MLFKSIILIVALATVYGQVPIPTRPDGFAVGPFDAHVVVEMYADLICPGCKAAWPTVLKLIQYYGQKIQLVLHTFPLPYHTNAFIAAQGLHVIANVTNRDLNSILAYTTLVFENQQLWYNQATINSSMTEVLQSLANFVDKTQITTADKFIRGLQDDDINDQTRISWKYACSRGITGTPSFMINGVAVSADASWSLDDWKSVIDPLLASKRPSFTPSANDDCPTGETKCTYAPHKTQCCLNGERCIPNVGCRC